MTINLNYIHIMYFQVISVASEIVFYIRTYVHTITNTYVHTYTAVPTMVVCPELA